MASIRIKLHVGGRTFRRTLENASALDLASLHGWVAQCTTTTTTTTTTPSSSSTEGVHAPAIVLTYEDEDGDRPCIATEDDLKEALAQHQVQGGSQPLRIFVDDHAVDTRTRAHTTQPADAHAGPTTTTKAAETEKGGSSAVGEEKEGEEKQSGGCGSGATASDGLEDMIRAAVEAFTARTRASGGGGCGGMGGHPLAGLLSNPSVLSNIRAWKPCIEQMMGGVPLETLIAHFLEAQQRRSCSQGHDEAASSVGGGGGDFRADATPRDWSAELHALADMGFYDTDRCVQLLGKYGGSAAGMQRVINELVIPQQA